ncbi:MAG TPA: DNA polymerase Y family protein [Rhodanobacteraceae bacterium]|nr:DNA polymerase Y family protein [Rhodanobacteraceae bacterium]
MLWACLLFPKLPFEALPLEGAFDETVAEGVSAPCCRALSESAGKKPHGTAGHPQGRSAAARPGRPGRIAFANDAARRAGVSVGQPLAAAQARCPQLVVQPRDCAAETGLLESLAAWAYRFSGQVALVLPDGLLLEVGASLRLFGEWPALQRRMRAELQALGHAHALAVAPVAAGAHVLAGCRDGLAVRESTQLVHALGDVPLPASGLDAPVVAALRGMGFRRLREVFALPRAELARRIGTDALSHLDRVRGFAAEAPALYSPPDRFERRIEFEACVENRQSLLFPLQRLIRELVVFLAARDGGVQRFELVLDHEGRATTRIAIGLLAPQREADALLEFARGRLERVTLCAPVTALGLVAGDLPPFCPLARDLFDNNRNQTMDWPRLTERLRARLGDAALRGLACVADHRPERAWHHGDDATPVAEARPRPFWLLPRPIPLPRAPAQILAGPERIEGGWWDGDDVRRDYYVVETALGQRAWAFRPAGATGTWMLHGWFA